MVINIYLVKIVATQKLFIPSIFQHRHITISVTPISLCDETERRRRLHEQWKRAKKSAIVVVVLVKGGFQKSHNAAFAEP